MAVSTQDSSSSPSAFQSDTLGDTQIPMAKLKIQSNQKILLERNDSWVSQAQAQSFVNVPPEVIAQLRQLHTSLEPSKAKDIEARQSSAAEGAGHLTQDGLHQDRPPGRLSGDNCYEEETVATQLSWSSSQITPPRIQKATTSFSTSQPFGSQIPVRSPVRSMTGETAATQISWSPSPTPPRTQKPTTSCAISQASLSQLPEKPPLQPTLDASNIQKRPTFNEFPSSSPGVEDELEVVAPAAYTKEVLPLNKVPPLASGMDPTPPSAQVQVSSTIDHNSSVGAQPMQSKPNKPRQKVYKALNIESSQELVKPRLAQPTGATPWGLRVPAQPVTSLDLSIIPNSLYIIPSTNNEQHTQNPVDSHPPLSFVPIRETPRRKRTSLGIEESTKLTSPEYRPSSPVTLVTQPQTPFYLYSESYPSYTGSLDSFLVTCVYIHNRIQRRRELASYQYDDFIRAWYQDYVPYSKSCEAPLGAVPWYMENHGTLEFSKNIVTKENLKAILNFYPIELASAHEKLRAAQQATELAQETATRLQAKLACSPHPRSQLSPIQASSVMLPVVEVDNGSDKMVGAVSPHTSHIPITDRLRSTAGNELGVRHGTSPMLEAAETSRSDPPRGFRKGPQQPVTACMLEDLTVESTTREPAKTAYEPISEIEVGSPPMLPPLPRPRDPTNVSLQATNTGPKKVVVDTSLTRSISGRSSSRKRPAMEELNSSTSKRVSIGSFLGSDAASSTSKDSAPSRNKAKLLVNGVAANPELRTRRFDKFLKKCKRKERESIASSAPVGTPTLEQGRY